MSSLDARKVVYWERIVVGSCRVQQKEGEVMVAVFSIGRLQFALEIFESRGCHVRMILTSLFWEVLMSSSNRTLLEDAASLRGSASNFMADIEFYQQRLAIRLP